MEGESPGKPPFPAPGASRWRQSSVQADGSLSGSRMQPSREGRSAYQINDNKRQYTLINASKIASVY
jgi:hypothetical protein